MTTTDLGSGAPPQRPTPDAQAFLDMQASPEFRNSGTGCGASSFR